MHWVMTQDERLIYWLDRRNCSLSITIVGNIIDKVQTFDFLGLTCPLAFEGLVIAFPLTLSFGYFSSFSSLITLFRYPDKRIVTIMKVYIERNNLQL